MLGYTMDVLDKHILMELSTDSRVSYTYLSRKYNVSVNTVKNRVNRMVESGVIAGFSVEVNPFLFNADIFLILFESTRQLTQEESDILGAYQIVSSVGYGLNRGVVTGYYRSHNEFSKFLDELLRYDIIDDYEVLFMVELGQLEPKVDAIEDVMSSRDWQIIHYLIANGRESLNSLAKKTGLSSRTVRKRINFLKDSWIARPNVLLNPGGTQTGFMGIFKTELENLDELIHSETEKTLRAMVPFEFWTSWRVIDKPILLISFYVEGMNEMYALQDKVTKLLKPISLSTLLGGSMHYYPDFRDSFVKKMAGI